MRSTRALLATLGTSISLVAAGVLALFAVSTFVAFKGWPDIRDGGSSRQPGLVLPTAVPAASPAAALVPAGRTLVLGARASSTTAPRSGIRGTRERSVPAPGSPTATDTPTASTPGPASSAPAPSTAGGSGTPSTPAGQPKVGDVVRDTAGAVSGATRDLTGAAGQALTPVSPAVGTTVQQTGDTAASTVDGAARTAAGVVDTLLPAQP
jgi:hypothetical protein